MASKLMQVLDDQKYIDAFYKGSYPCTNSPLEGSLEEVLEDSDVDSEFSGVVDSHKSGIRFKDKAKNNRIDKSPAFDATDPGLSEIEGETEGENFEFFEEKCSLSSIGRKCDVDYIAHKCYIEIINYFNFLGLEIGTSLTYPKFYDWFIENTKGGYLKY